MTLHLAAPECHAESQPPPVIGASSSCDPATTLRASYRCATSSSLTRHLRACSSCLRAGGAGSRATCQHCRSGQRYAPRPARFPLGSTSRARAGGGPPADVRTTRINSRLGRFCRQAMHVRSGTCLRRLPGDSLSGAMAPPSLPRQAEHANAAPGRSGVRKPPRAEPPGAFTPNCTRGKSFPIELDCPRLPLPHQQGACRS